MKITILSILLAAAAYGQQLGTDTAANNAHITVTANSTGVTANLLAAKDTSNPIKYQTSGSGGCGSGIAATTATSTTFELYVLPGLVVSGVADNAITAGHILVGGTTTPGRVKDSGQTAISAIDSATCIVGIAQANASTAGSILLRYFGPGQYGAQINTIGGVTITGTPTSGQVPTASSGSAAAWATPAGGSGCTSVGAADDYVVMGAPGPYGINSYLDVTQSHLTLGGNGVTIISRIYMPCAFTPGVMTFVLTTGGSAGCHFSIGVYDVTRARVIYSGILTDSTATADCDSTGTKTLTSGTTPAATGLGTTYPAGWYYVAATSDTAGAGIVLKGLPMSAEDSTALLSVAPNMMGNLTGSQITTGGALNASFTTGAGWTSATSGGTFYLALGH